MSEALNDIITEAKLIKTALGSSLPVSWSALEDDGISSGNIEHGNEKIDSVSAAGFEMVELLILAAQLLKENTTKGGS